jgi:hypothetical protein
MKYEAVTQCAIALLSGAELRTPYSIVRFRKSESAYDTAVRYVAAVGEKQALEAARAALAGGKKKTKKGKVRWL